MGCFMGCFGLSSNKKKNRNSFRKIRDQRICSYERLHSSDPTDSSTIVDNSDKISNSNLMCEVDKQEEEKKKGTTKKTRKRVRFNLNVQTYEPILPTRYENYCSDDEEEKGETSKGSSVIDKIPEDLSSRFSNYIYQNCVDSFEDEEAELGYGESDLEDEDYYTDDDYEDDDEDEEDRDQDVTPLLDPVENIAQWKAVKAKLVRVKQLMKENVEVDTIDDQTKPLLKEILVNTSLSNWLASPKTFHGIGSSKRSPIVDITNMDNR